MTSPSDRITLKLNAKRAMRRGSPAVYLVTLLNLVLGFLPALVTTFPRVNTALLYDTPEEIFEAYANYSAGSSVFLSLALLAMTIFLSLVSVGYVLYTLRLSRGEEPGGCATLFTPFQQFWRFVSANILMGLYVFLWSLLFIIPGIIAAFSYSQTYYIMLDHPEMSAMEAIRESKRLMQGHKMEYFVLNLTFFGWMLLEGLTLGILSIWTTPYLNLTFAGYYDALVGRENYGGQGAGSGFEPPEDNWWENQN